MASGAGGAAGGAGGLGGLFGGGGMSSILMLLGLVLGLVMMCSSQEESTKNQKDVMIPQPPEAPTAGTTQPGNACADGGFFVCNTCAGESVTLPAGGDNVCCKTPCAGQGGQVAGGSGTSLATCAFQKGFQCTGAEYCPENQWMPAQDTSRCCQAGCKARIQAEGNVADFGKIVVEKFAPGRFGVYYGPGVSIGNTDLGKVNYADAVPKGNMVYEFVTQDKKTFQFALAKDTDTEIALIDSVVPGIPSIAKPSELEAKAYLVGHYNPGTCYGMPTIITNVEKKNAMVPELVQFVSQQFGIPATNEDAIFGKIKQLGAVSVTNAPYGYDFAVRDGRCCVLVSTYGKLMIETGLHIEGENSEQSTVPC